MPFRFRRTFKILPGVKINLSKGGVSVTVGPRGYHLNFGKQGIRQTIDFPGAGLSHTSYLFKDDDDDKKRDSEKDHHRERRDADDDNDAVGCFPFGCLLFLLVAVVGGYFVADYFNWIPQNYLSDLMLQVTQWLKRLGF